MTLDERTRPLLKKRASTDSKHMAADSKHIAADSKHMTDPAPAPHRPIRVKQTAAAIEMQPGRHPGNGAMYSVPEACAFTSQPHSGGADSKHIRRVASRPDSSSVSRCGREASVPSQEWCPFRGGRPSALPRPNSRRPAQGPSQAALIGQQARLPLSSTSAISLGSA